MANTYNTAHRAFIVDPEIQRSQSRRARFQESKQCKRNHKWLLDIRITE